jgi:antitoxin PrlF
MKFRAIVSEKGQVTVPKRLRERLGIKPGEVLEFTEEEGRLVARKTAANDSIDEVYGILDLDASTDQIMDRLRDYRSNS